MPKISPVHHVFDRPGAPYTPWGTCGHHALSVALPGVPGFVVAQIAWNEAAHRDQVRVSARDQARRCCDFPGGWGGWCVTLSGGRQPNVRLLRLMLGTAAGGCTINLAG